ncbi:hypothetical protein PVAND_002550 [Polypedilum vanderplanki]|uniref:Uncharacterized protein n=1 Tax=Polypedilum vanderplanki TaxID=319348 RepID=A0A9J6BRC1_POLVA|nr:hypothetical protein PVAND_002550 [Polypedilum vanderplanki]
MIQDQHRKQVKNQYMMKKISKRICCIYTKIDAEKEDSRPVSQASTHDEKEFPVKSDDRKESVASVQKLNIEKEDSRPLSQASVTSEKSTHDEKESSMKTDDRKESIDSLKDAQSKKEASRPESQASMTSHKSVHDEETTIKRNAKNQLDLDFKKEDSRPLNQASVISEKSAHEEIPENIDDRKESIISLTTEKKDRSRPSSQASATSEKLVHDDKEIPAKLEDQKESVQKLDTQKKIHVQHQASIISEKSIHDEKEISTQVDRKESVISATSEKKDKSRPLSQASHVSEKSMHDEKDEPIKLEDRKESIASVQKEGSRPLSQTSHVSEKSTHDEKDGTLLPEEHKTSVDSIQNLDVEKESSRPASQTSERSTHDDKESPKNIDDRKESVASVRSFEHKLEVMKDDSRPASQASENSLHDEKESYTKSAEDRKESVASAQKLDTEKKDSRSLSVEREKSVHDEEEIAVKPDDRKEPIVSLKEEIKIASRPESQASMTSHKSTHEEGTTIKSEDRKESGASIQKENSRPVSQLSEKSINDDKKSSSKLDDRKESIASVTSETKKEDSRPLSQASAASEKMLQEEIKSAELIETRKEDSRPLSQASAVSDKIIAAEKNSVEQTVIQKERISNVRPYSPASDGEEDADIEVQAIESTSDINFERPASPASVSSQFSDTAKDSKHEEHVADINIRRKSSVSVASDVAGVIEEHFSRPETPLSTECDKEEEEVKETEEKIEDRRESLSKAERLFESRRESHKSTTDDSVVAFPINKEFDLLEDKVFMKESRSKSVSSICSSSSRTDDFGKLSAIEEILAASREDLKIKIHEENSKLTEDLVKTETVITSFPVSSSEKNSSVTVTGFPIHEECSKVIKVENLISIDSSEAVNDPEKIGEKATTPPTAPISPNVVTTQKPSCTTTTITSTTTVQEVKPSEILEKAYEYSTPRDSIHSGRSSPDSAASKSIILGHGSAVESPESSPKPTSPFPKTDLLKDDDHKTTSGISTPDMTRTSTPDTTEKLVELGKSSKIDKSEFKSKVHTQEYTYHTETKEIFPDQSSYHSEWSRKHGDDDENAYGETIITQETNTFEYGDDDEIPPKYEEIKSSVTSYQIDPMSTSFYGTLPDATTTVVRTSTIATSSASDNAKSVPIPITSTLTRTELVDFSSNPDAELQIKKFTKYLDDADLDFEKTFQQQSGIHTITTTTSSEAKESTSASTESYITTITTTSSSTTVQSSSTTQKDEEKLWEKPLGLPSPAPENDVRTTPKRERKLLANKNKLNLQKRSQNPLASKKTTAPIYMDLAYVPHHGNSYYSHVEFFKKVRARYYVFSGTEPSKEVYNALLEAKQTWEDKNLEVTIIPTYDTDVLGYWVSENEELLAKYHIDLSPSAARCTINLQDHETSCSAYRLEF